MNLYSMTAALFLAASSAVAGPWDPAGTVEERPPISMLSLAAGQPEGGYYEQASRLQSVVSENTLDHRLMLSTIATPGSVHNGLEVALGTYDLGLMQADILEEMSAGRPPAPAGAPMPLSALFVTGEEYFVLIAKEQSNVAGIDGLARLRVGIGAAGTGARFTARRILIEAGLQPGTMKLDETSGISQRADRFCSGKLEAVSFVTSLPNPTISRLLQDCGGGLIGLDAGLLDRLTAKSAAYDRGEAPVGAPVRGGGMLKVKSVVVTSTTPDAEVESLLKVAFDPAQLQRLRLLRFSGNLSDAPPPPQGLPTHPVAASFFACCGSVEEQERLASESQ
ncbi:hypothetical protein KHP62_19040 [Rhodobacteraceae bacterium NNCM2]|nr:hypothetical protein [Coraliihabitans acroporae]